MENVKSDVRPVAGRGASGDDAARFLRELRQLRDGAGLGQAELAARAHYPYDAIRAAESGPALPDLPVLSAYVRGCGGTTEDWEERWRSLTRTPSLPVPTAREAGRSDAATAGARIGSVAQVTDGVDPSVIIAALHRVGEEMASGGTDSVPASPAVESLPDLPSLAPVPISLTAAPTAAAAAAGAEPGTGRKPAGWDPIRVSSAWPALRGTPAEDAAFVGGTGSSTGSDTSTAAPWEAAPWAEDPLGDLGGADAAAATAATGWASPGSADPGVASLGETSLGSASSATVAGGPAAAGKAGSADAITGRSSAHIGIMVVAAVLLCVLAVLLALFA